MKTYKGMIKELEPNQIFVYGCNPQYRHGAGAAKIAHEKYGAIYGKGPFCGQSYGIITKNLLPGYIDNNGKVYKLAGLRSISGKEIMNNIKDFYSFAEMYSDLEFYVAYTKNGSNLNGYSDKEMAYFFENAKEYIPENVVFQDEFYKMMKTTI